MSWTTTKAMISARSGESFGILARRIRVTCRRRESLSSAARVDVSWRDSISVVAAARSSWNPVQEAEQRVDQFGDGECRCPFLDPLQGVVETSPKRSRRASASAPCWGRTGRATRSVHRPRGDLGHRYGVVTLLGKQGNGCLQESGDPPFATLALRARAAVFSLGLDICEDFLINGFARLASCYHRRPDLHRRGRLRMSSGRRRAYST